MCRWGASCLVNRAVIYDRREVQTLTGDLLGKAWKSADPEDRRRELGQGWGRM